jgi:hypothetical protein
VLTFDTHLISGSAFCGLMVLVSTPTLLFHFPHKILEVRLNTVSFTFGFFKSCFVTNNHQDSGLNHFGTSFSKIKSTNQRVLLLSILNCFLISASKRDLFSDISLATSYTFPNHSSAAL